MPPGASLTMAPTRSGRPTMSASTSCTHARSGADGGCETVCRRVLPGGCAGGGGTVTVLRRDCGALVTGDLRDEACGGFAPIGIGGRVPRPPDPGRPEGQLTRLMDGSRPLTGGLA